MRARLVALLALACYAGQNAEGQDVRRRSSTYDPYQVREVETIPDEIKMVRGDKLKAFRIVPEVGRVERVQMPDTLTHYTFEYHSPEYRSLGVAYQGNISHPWQAKLFFDRPRRMQDFFYQDGYSRLFYTPDHLRHLPEELQ